MQKKTTMKTLITTLILLGLTVQLTAQLQYQKIYNWTYDNFGYSLEKAANGYLLLGSTKTATNQLDVLLIKTNLNGDTLWTKTYGGTSDDVGYCIKKTTDNGFIIAGYTESFGIGQEDVYLIKVDSLGTQQWTKTFGADSTDIGYSVDQLTDNGFIVAGYTKSFGGGLEDIYLIRTDSLGNSVWDNPFGGSCKEIGRSVISTSDNSFVVAGQTDGYVGTGWLIHSIKVSSTGNLMWAKTFDFSVYTSDKQRFGYSVLENNQQEYLIAGGVGLGFIGDGAPVLLNLDTAGNLNWSEIYVFNSGDCAIRSIIQTPDNGYILGGYEGGGPSTVGQLKVDSTGQAEWAMIYYDLFSGSQGNDADYTTDNGYVVMGFYHNAGDTSTFLVKTDNLGSSGSVQDLEPTGNANPIAHTTNVLVPDTSCNPTSIQEDLAFSDFKIYPNPASQNTTLEFDNSRQEKYTLTLYDTQGRLTRTISNITTDHLTIDTDDLTGGLYFFQLRTDRQVRATGKLIIE